MIVILQKSYIKKMLWQFNKEKLFPAGKDNKGVHSFNQ